MAVTYVLLYWLIAMIHHLQQLKLPLLYKIVFYYFGKIMTNN
jgi:hypothetical protein